MLFFSQFLCTFVAEYEKDYHNTTGDDGGFCHLGTDDDPCAFHLTA